MLCLPMLCLLCQHASAAALNFTVNTSRPVTVTGTPRIAIDVGGVTRYATYAAGSGTAALSFSYQVQAGDFDANGIALVSPLELNGGTLVDAVGNPATNLAFTAPDTANLKVQTYTAAFATSPVTSANANAVSFTIAKAPAGASFSYTITSSGGSGSVTGSGTISGASHTVSNVDVSNLAAGTLTLSVTVSTAQGGTGAARSSTSVPMLASGVLDSPAAAAASFAVRRLRAAHTGALIRVRRSSDSTQQDIASTIAGDLDTTSLMNFCGSASCFVTTWYDQSGNGQNAVQAAAASQPRIVNAGTLEVEGGRPALRYTAAGQILVFPGMPSQTIQTTLSAVARQTDTAVMRHIMGNRDPNGGRIIRSPVGGGGYQLSNINGGGVTVTGSTLQQRIITMVSGPSLQVLGALDGITTGPIGSNFFSSAGVFWIGGGGATQSATGDWIGTISEAMVFNYSMSTANRQTLERSQGAYFGVTVP
jgi:hypothetical protein